MCLIAFAWKAHPRYRLVVAANRDELHSRPTAPAAYWDDAPHLFAGRDLQDGGTWMGLTTAGRFAALTNYRDPNEFKAGAPSRGKLVANFLREAMSPLDYADGLGATQYLYNGFNLLFGDGQALWYVGNRSGAPREVEPGVHGLSNALLDTAWPKTVKLQSALAEALRAGPEPDDLMHMMLAALGDRSAAPDAQLPDTGMGLQRERELAPPMIVNSRYGTRSSSVLLIDHAGNIEVVERSYTPDGIVSGQVRRSIAAGA